MSVHAPWRAHRVHACLGGLRGLVVVGPPRQGVSGGALLGRGARGVRARRPVQGQRRQRVAPQHALQNTTVQQEPVSARLLHNAIKEALTHGMQHRCISNPCADACHAHGLREHLARPGVCSLLSRALAGYHLAVESVSHP